ncbi:MULTISPECIES: DUF3487 family protein [Pseudomonas]|uniref:DUF3487 family protein n=1 Tax=Pseudomonas quercus TaxID=2722792 RepID=A0ABX0YCY4_9PSED|nr:MULTISPECIES: DUF3487 family protein [Pseudomonas]MBF7141547.1 DUF3487 family protein [Pseudomonas sp. LY10J]NJP00086.1 DUF3487 family protein [Pseudomonas quercus]
MHRAYHAYTPYSEIHPGCATWGQFGLTIVVGAMLLGSGLAWVAHSIALLPTCIVAAITVGVFAGGGVLQGLKRGRTDTWLHRRLHSWGSLRYPGLTQRLGFLALGATLRV